ncbi:MAG: hypothetical protein KTR31_01735, partial [Myxococcales bacterium]|nr:hypothetical protein [Myxococcales bacterium]
VSADDALGIHERAGPLLRDTLLGASEWFPSYSWQLVFGPPLALTALAMAAFLLRFLDRALLPWFFGAMTLFAFAVGLDFVEGIDDAFEALADGIGVRTYTVSHLSKVLEETAELAATTTLLGTFTAQLLRTLRTTRVDFTA